jgi:hypothetical protein
MRFNSFKFNFPDFQQLRSKDAKYVVGLVFLIVTHWLELGTKKPKFHKLGVRFSTILADSKNWKMLSIQKVNAAYQIL